MDNRLNFALLKCDKHVLAILFSVLAMAVLLFICTSISTDFINLDYINPRKVIVEDTVSDRVSYYLIINDDEKRELIEVQFEEYALAEVDDEIFLLTKPQIYELSFAGKESKTIWYQNDDLAKRNIELITNNNNKISKIQEIITLCIGCLSLVISILIVIINNSFKRRCVKK